MTMTIPEQIITIFLCTLATVATRFLPFLIFSGKKETPKFVQYLGNALPAAIFGMLIVYCLKDVQILNYSYGIPELLGIAATVALHLWKKNILISIGVGTVFYMLLVQFVFV